MFLLEHCGFDLEDSWFPAFGWESDWEAPPPEWSDWRRSLQALHNQAEPGYEKQ